MSNFLNYAGVVVMVAVGAAMAHYWPDMVVYGVGLAGIGLGWLGKHLAS